MALECRPGGIPPAQPPAVPRRELPARASLKRGRGSSREVDPAAAQDEEEALASALKALAHPKRLRILRFATTAASLEEIANDLKVARQSAQEHVDQLLALRLLEPIRGRGDHGPVTRYVVVVARVFDVYDRLGTRLGLLAADLEQDVRLHLPTSPLASRVGAGGAPTAPQLTIVHGMRVGQTIPLTGAGPWLLGRDAAATICLDYDGYVSHRHAEVRRGSRGFELADALSSNGVFVDWARVPRGGVAPLSNGSIVRAGKTLLVFRMP